MPRKARNARSARSAQPIPRQQEQAIVRKVGRELKGGRRRWNVDVAGLNLGSFAGGAGVKGISFGTTPKAKLAKGKKNILMPYSDCPNWDDADGSGCYCPGAPHGNYDTMRARGYNLGGLNARSDMVGVAPRSMNLQVIQPRITSTFSNGVQVDILEGTDIVGPVNLTTVKDTGDVLMEAYISPSAFHATRMSQLAPLYQRYRFLEIEFLYEPVANATVSGQVIGFCTFDPDSPLEPSNTMNLNKAAAFYGNRQNQVWEAASYGQHQPNTMTDLYVDPAGADSRLSYQGIFYLIAAGDLASSGLALGQIGNVYVRYKLALSIPQLQAGVGAISASRYGCVPEIASGNPALLGDSGLVALGTSNTVTVQDLTADKIRILGVSSGSFLMVGLSGDWAGSGGTLSTTGVGGDATGASALEVNGSASVYNGAGGAFGFLGLYQVDASATQVDIQFTCTNMTGLTGSGSGLLSVTIFPPTVAEMILARRLSNRRIDELYAYFRPMLEEREKARKVRPGREAVPVENCSSVSKHEVTARADRASLIGRHADARHL